MQIQSPQQLQGYSRPVSSWVSWGSCLLKNWSIPSKSLHVCVWSHLWCSIILLMPAGSPAMSRVIPDVGSLCPPSLFAPSVSLFVLLVFSKNWSFSRWFPLLFFHFHFIDFCSHVPCFPLYALGLFTLHFRGSWGASLDYWVETSLLSSFQHTSPAHALLDSQPFHFSVIIGGEADSGAVQLFLRPPWRPSLMGGFSLGRAGATGWLLSLLPVPGRGGCLPLVLPLWLQSVGFPCTWAVPAGVSQMPFILHVGGRCPWALGTTAPGQGPPWAASASHLPAIHSRFRNRVLGGAGTNPSPMLPEAEVLPWFWT